MAAIGIEGWRGLAAGLLILGAVGVVMAFRVLWQAAPLDVPAHEPVPVPVWPLLGWSLLGVAGMTAGAGLWQVLDRAAAAETT